MMSNVDPKLRDWLARSTSIQSWLTVDDSAPVVLRFRDGSTLRMRNDVPKTRGDCPAGVCPHIRCSQHLWVSRGNERAGRRVAGRSPDTTLRDVARLSPLPPSCALAVADAAADRGEVTPIEDVAGALGIRQSRVFEILATAERKLKALGMSLEALMEGDR